MKLLTIITALLIATPLLAQDDGYTVGPQESFRAKIRVSQDGSVQMDKQPDITGKFIIVDGEQKLDKASAIVSEIRSYFSQANNQGHLTEFLNQLDNLQDAVDDLEADVAMHAAEIRGLKAQVFAGGGWELVPQPQGPVRYPENKVDKQEPQEFPSDWR